MPFSRTKGRLAAIPRVASYRPRSSRSSRSSGSSGSSTLLSSPTSPIDVPDRHAADAQLCLHRDGASSAFWPVRLFCHPFQSLSDGAARLLEEIHEVDEKWPGRLPAIAAVVCFALEIVWILLRSSV